MESKKNHLYVKPKLKTTELAPVQCLALFTKRFDRLGSEDMLPLSCNNSRFVDLTSQKLELYDESLPKYLSVRSFGSCKTASLAANEIPSTL